MRVLEFFAVGSFERKEEKKALRIKSLFIDENLRLKPTFLRDPMHNQFTNGI